MGREIARRYVLVSVLLGALLGAGGCVSGQTPGSTQSPSLTLSRASLAADEALVEFSVTNPNAAAMRLDSIEYTLLLGPVPVGSGVSERGGESIPGGRSLEIAVRVPARPSGLSPTPRTAELSGVMKFRGAGSGALTEAPFRSSVRLSGLPD